VERSAFLLPTLGPGVANAIIALNGGGYAAVGYADTGFGTDVVLVRFDARGDTVWTREYGGGGNEFGWDVVEVGDGGMFVAGLREAPSPGHEDVLLLRVDSAGSLIWERSFGGAGRDRAWFATLARDGAVVLAAETEELDDGGLSDMRDAQVIAVGEDGTLRWIRTLEAAGDQRVFQIAQTPDGQYVVAGTTAPADGSDRDVYVARLDANGRVLWTRDLGQGSDEVGHGVTALPDGQVIVTGYGATPTNDAADVYLMRLDASGRLVWWHNHGTQAEEHAMMTFRRANGRFATAGYRITTVGADILVIESDASGELWASTVLEQPGNDRGVMIQPWGPRGYVIAGTVGGTGSGVGRFAVLWVQRGEP
jgi:hypothetical protein